MRRVPVVEELLPAPDPWGLARSLASLPHLLFLDSADRSAAVGRYSFVTADPVRWVELPRVATDDPFALLQPLLDELPEPIPGLPPFQGGLAGLFGYGLAHAVERFPRPPIDEFRTPDLAVGLYDWVVALDHTADRAWLIAHSPERMAWAKTQLHGGPILARSRPAVEPVTGMHPLPGYPHVFSNFARASYQRTIGTAVEYVHAGDCFQVNVAQRLLTRSVGSPLELYGRLRERNPAPFAAYFDMGGHVVASASPERFLKVEGRNVETCPIKGTRPRGGDAASDAAIAAELARSSKDRAENVMIVDLLRNDLGRVCEYGSVLVPRVCEVESFRFVHHLVSTVTGTLRAERTALDLMRATFPGGSVTGAPKVRALEIISELEGVARGPYCGSIGYISGGGAMDSSILIRTFTASGGWLQFPVGGGIVADSDPAREYEETLHKAAGLLASIGK